MRPMNVQRTQTRRHGTRAAYVFGVGPERGTGCRCEECRTANRNYQRGRDRARRRPDEELKPARVDATEAREHLLWLGKEGVGLRTVSERSGIARSTLGEIRSGRRLRCTPRLVDKVLAVGLHRASNGCHIDASHTWQLLDELFALGYSKTEIARQLGSTAKHPALQIGKRHVTRRKATQVEDLHEILTAEVYQRRERGRAAQRISRQRRKDAGSQPSDGRPNAAERSPK